MRQDTWGKRYLEGDARGCTCPPALLADWFGGCVAQYPGSDAEITESQARLLFRALLSLSHSSSLLDSVSHFSPFSSSIVKNQPPYSHPHTDHWSLYPGLVTVHPHEIAFNFAVLHDLEHLWHFVSANLKNLRRYNAAFPGMITVSLSKAYQCVLRA